MKLKKEFFLIIGISSFIIILEVFTNFVTEKSVAKIEGKIDSINNKLEAISKMQESDLEYKKEIEDEIKKLKDDWFEEQDKLSIIAEHNELEKVSRCLITLEENAKNEEYKIALEDGSEFKYWLKHIKEKDKLEIKNIF